MRQLIGLLLVVVVAVAVTLMAQGNASKVLVFSVNTESTCR